MDAEGINPDPVNLAKIEEWAAPTEVKQIRQYLGLTSYFRSQWQWMENEHFAYSYLKHKLLSGTACSYPDFRKQFILKSDACGTTVGAILSQLDKKEHLRN